jgi:pullulanase
MRLVVLLIFSIFLIQFSCAPDYYIEYVKMQGDNWFEVTYRGALSKNDLSQWKIEPEVKIENVEISESKAKIRVSENFKLDQHYYLHTGKNKFFLIPDGILDSLYSDKPLGYQIEGSNIYFRVFAPRAKLVKILHFYNVRDKEGEEFLMTRDKDGVWEFTSSSDWQDDFYGYKIWGPTGDGEIFDSTIVLADPYSPAVATINHYTHPGKTLIQKPSKYNWKGNRWQKMDWRDLIIYEMHVRDLSAHPSSGLAKKDRGYYRSVLEKNQKGGLPYIKSLGVNAVELLPAQDFANIEVPYEDKDAPVYNTWNPYARNHWGYMTSYFFAPESYYADYGNMVEGDINGADGLQINEFKEMVQTFHQNGIAVLMDVVYNHVSQYDYNPLKYIDKFYYFRLNDDCTFESVSGCGNDFKTERPMARRLIVESVLHWINEYHVDGFRFDLAKLIDWQTCDEILKTAQKANPQVVIIAEPWGGGYDPYGFSDHGWASWNDQIRNGVKGQNPNDGLGFIFGDWQGDNNRISLQRYVMGSLRQFGGQYQTTSHSVNYLASHDDNTLGDFIRLGLREVSEQDSITDLVKNAQLSPLNLKTNKLAAIFLLTVQGPVMIHEGQEFARSKVIAPTDAPDKNVGRIDHNSYNKDNPTNWLNFDFAEMNSDLVNYYRGLIELRKAHSAFGQANPENFTFLDTADSLFLVYELNFNRNHYFVLLNGNQSVSQNFQLSKGTWGVLADWEKAGSTPYRVISQPVLEIPSTSGMVLVKE